MRLWLCAHAMAIKISWVFRDKHIYWPKVLSMQNPCHHELIFILFPLWQPFSKCLLVFGSPSHYSYIICPALNQIISIVHMLGFGMLFLLILPYTNWSNCIEFTLNLQMCQCIVLFKSIDLVYIDKSHKVDYACKYKLFCFQNLYFFKFDASVQIFLDAYIFIFFFVFYSTALDMPWIGAFILYLWRTL